MADIGKELAELIHEDFKRRLAGDKWAQRIIREGAAANMDDVARLSKQLGLHLSSAVSWHISDKELPLGEEMEEIARQILEPLLQQNYELINRVADDAQRRLDKARGINIEPQHPNFPRERADTVYKSAAEPGKSQDVIKRRMTVPPENITRNMSDSYMKANAELRSKAGFETYIVRTDDGNCCPWCAKLVGRYVYPEGVPKDVFRRHDNCGCRVVYECGNMRQNVHSKETWEQPSADIPELVKNPDVEIPEPVRNPDYRETVLYRANALTNEAESSILKNIKLDDILSAAAESEIYEEVINEIFDTMTSTKVTYLFDAVKVVNLDSNIVMQTEPVMKGTFFEITLNLNENFFGGKTVAQLDMEIQKSKKTVANSLKEATIHEIYHAKLINGLNRGQLEALYELLSEVKIDGISPTAYIDGSECIAELGVLFERGDISEIPKEAVELFNKYIGGIT